MRERETGEVERGEAERGEVERGEVEREELVATLATVATALGSTLTTVAVAHVDDFPGSSSSAETQLSNEILLPPLPPSFPVPSDLHFHSIPFSKPPTAPTPAASVRYQQVLVNLPSVTEVRVSKCAQRWDKGLSN